MIRHTLTPLPNGNFLLKMYESDQTPSNVVEPLRGRCLQTTEVSKEDADAIAQCLWDNLRLKQDAREFVKIDTEAAEELRAYLREHSGPLQLLMTLDAKDTADGVAT